MIRDNLTGDSGEEWMEFLEGFGDEDIPSGGIGRFVGDDEDFPVPGSHFLDGWEVFFVEEIRRHEDNRGKILVHERERAMFELATRKCLGVEVGYFFELEAWFVGDGELKMTSEEEELFIILDMSDYISNFCGISKEFLYFLRYMLELLDDLSILLSREITVFFSEIEREQEDGAYLGGKCLGRGNSYFGPRSREEPEVRESGDRRSDDIDYPKCLGSFGSEVFERFDRVGRLPRLRDENIESFWVHLDIFVFEFTRNLDSRFHTG